MDVPTIAKLAVTITITTSICHQYSSIKVCEHDADEVLVLSHASPDMMSEQFGMSQENSTVKDLQEQNTQHA